MLESSAKALEKYKGRRAQPPPLPKVMVVEDEQILRPTKEVLALRAEEQARRARRRQRAQAWRRALLVALGLCLCVELALLASHVRELRERLRTPQEPAPQAAGVEAAASTPIPGASSPEPAHEVTVDAADDVRPGWGLDLSDGHRAAARHSTGTATE